MDNKIKKRLLWAGFWSIVIMAVLLIKVDWEQFSAVVERITFINLLYSFLLLLLANFIRTLRFRKMDHLNDKLSQWWIMNQIYNFMTATLPGGAGEIVTVYLLNKFSSFNILIALRMLLLSRLMDLAGLAIVLCIAAYHMKEITPYRGIVIWVSGAVFLAAIIFTHPKTERMLLKLLEKFSIKGRFMNKVFEKLEELSNVSEEALKNGIFKVVIAQSVLLILFAALSVHFVLVSFGTGFQLVQSFYCFGIYALFQIVPVQGLAGIGTQAAWWSISLKISGYDSPDIIAMGILLHATFYILIAVMGLTGMLIVPIAKKSS